MNLSYLFWQIFIFLIYPSIISTVALYLYPAFFACSFPAPRKFAQAECLVDGSIRNVSAGALAPFRLLVFADPQLEGDSSLPKPEDFAIPRYLNSLASSATSHERYPFTTAVSDLVTADIPLLAYSYRKRLDLFGNDYYLAHIYRLVHWWTNPTHVTVLGDLLGSQWIDDKEFATRSSRYWNRVFRGGRKIDENATNGITTVLGEDKEWKRRIINVAGNHDIGYAGDLTRDRGSRFEQSFGKLNWFARYQLPLSKSVDSDTLAHNGSEQPELRIIVLNTMNLDSPTKDSDMQLETYNFINDQIIKSSRPVEDTTSTTVLLTHIPLHKAAGICHDSPEILYGASGVREQNHLSPFSSKSILEGIYGMSGHQSAPNSGKGRSGIILTGHDHHGCDTYHYIKPNSPFSSTDADWGAIPNVLSSQLLSEDNDKQYPGIREITVRSMMGEFGGNVGMLSAWFDPEIGEKGEWKFEYATCAAGPQHLWWAVHVLDLVTVGFAMAALVAAVVKELREQREMKEGLWDKKVQ